MYPDPEGKVNCGLGKVFQQMMSLWRPAKSNKKSPNDIVINAGDYYYYYGSLFSSATRNRFYIILDTGDPVFYTQTQHPHC